MVDLSELAENRKWHTAYTIIAVVGILAAALVSLTVYAFQARDQVAHNAQRVTSNSPVVAPAVDTKPGVVPPSSLTSAPPLKGLVNPQPNDRDWLIHVSRDNLERGKEAPLVALELRSGVIWTYQPYEPKYLTLALYNGVEGEGGRLDPISGTIGHGTDAGWVAFRLPSSRSRDMRYFNVFRGRLNIDDKWSHVSEGLHAVLSESFRLDPFKKDRYEIMGQ